MRILNERPRLHFDPSSADHLREFQFFEKNRRWRVGCPFILEHPYLSVPGMIRDKLLHTYLDLVIDHADGQHIFQPRKQQLKEAA